MKNHPIRIALKVEPVQKNKRIHAKTRSRKVNAKKNFAYSLRLCVFACAFLSWFRHVRLGLCVFVLLCVTSASSQSLPQNDQAQFLNHLNVLWRFDTGG